MTKDDEKLTALFVRAKDGDKAARDEFAAIALHKLTNYVSAWCNKRGRSWDLAEDVAGASLMKAFGAADNFDPQKCGGKVMVWLIAVARREFVNCIRFMERGGCESLDEKLKRPTHGKNARDEDKHDALRLACGADPLEELIRREDDDRLKPAIRRLPELRRQVVELYRDHTPVGVIAVKLNLLPKRVYKILFDAKAELRRRVG